MRKLLFFPILVLGVCSFRSASSHPQTPDETKVYICDSDGATKYHYKKDCRGLNNCQHEVKYVSLNDAKTAGKKTLCGWED